MYTVSQNNKYEFDLYDNSLSLHEINLIHSRKSLKQLRE
jgi:hypothetical protein